MNEQLIKDIKHFEYKTNDKYELMENLLKKGYSEKEIIEEFDNFSFKPTWMGSLLGVLMIILAIAFIYSSRSTFGSFHYRFRSSGDFFRLSEWVLKPFLIVSLLFIGINTTVNFGNINKTVKRIMILAFTIELFLSSSYNSVLSLILALIGIIIFSFYSIPKDKNFSTAKALIYAVKNNRKKSVLKEIRLKEANVWKGSAIAIFLILAFILFLNSPIQLTSKITRQFGSHSYYKVDLKLIDEVLIFWLKFMALITFITAILLNINYNKFKISLYILMGFSFLFMLTTFFHQNFQEAIYPAILILISGIITITKPKKPIDKSNSVPLQES